MIFTHKIQVWFCFLHFSDFIVNILVGGIVFGGSVESLEIPDGFFII